MLRVKFVFSLICAAALLQSSFSPLLGQSSHIVTSADIQRALVKHSQDRQASLGTLERLFSRPEVAGALDKTVGGPKRIMQAASVLTDDELARLAQKASNIDRDFAAGALSNQDLTYIVIALATAVVILVIVAAK
jgi:hypothetical protein